MTKSILTGWKKVTVSALAVVMLLLSLPSVALASSRTYTVSVATGYLALRTAPAYDEANEIGELYSGETVTVTGGCSGDYVWVRSNKLGREGYVNSNYLVGWCNGGYSNSRGTSNYRHTNNSTSGRKYYVHVNTGYLALRTAAAYDESNEIGELYNCDYVTYAGGTNGDYWWVYSPKYDRCGYVNANYLV